MATRKSTVATKSVATNDLNTKGRALGMAVRKSALIGSEKAKVGLQVATSFGTGFWAGLMGR